MQMQTGSREFSDSASRLNLAFSRLQMIQNYIAATKELIAEQERHVRKTGFEGTDTPQDRLYLITMRQSLEVMNLYQKETLKFIEDLHVIDINSQRTAEPVELANTYPHF